MGIMALIEAVEFVLKWVAGAWISCTVFPYVAGIVGNNDTLHVFLESYANYSRTFVGTIADSSIAITRTRFHIEVGVSAGFFCLATLIAIKLLRVARVQNRRASGSVYREKPYPLLKEDFDRVGLHPMSDDCAGKELYLDLMKRSLTNLIYYESSVPTHIYGPDKRFRLAEGVSLKARMQGEDMPGNAMTMVGMKRLNNIQELVMRIFESNVEGDFIETGSCKGGATIFMRALLKAKKDTERKVFVCDTFEAEPAPTPWLAHTVLTTFTWVLASVPLKCWRRRLVNFLWKHQKISRLR